jgi:hypothetical protein
MSFSSVHFKDSGFLRKRFLQGKFMLVWNADLALQLYGPFTFSEARVQLPA